MKRKKRKQRLLKPARKMLLKRCHHTANYKDFVMTADSIIDIGIHFCECGDPECEFGTPVWAINLLQPEGLGFHIGGFIDERIRDAAYNALLFAWERGEKSFLMPPSGQICGDCGEMCSGLRVQRGIWVWKD